MCTTDTPDPGVAFPTYSMGPPLVDVTKALRLAGELEDDELARAARERRPERHASDGPPGY